MVRKKDEDHGGGGLVWNGMRMRKGKRMVRSARRLSRLFTSGGSLRERRTLGNHRDDREGVCADGIIERGFSHKRDRL